ncbi:sugar transferase [Romeria aff. gracilis LEGE 07310]|uniref:Sugar transferase n=1 Tax=Vasconcelosia minhoensis LEGE 07310 TaxID=915328 RepID=A0A8J7AKM6_9CYAN|nr:Npun_R2821/Npun_R2822 family protein [Romeria gracilis]MBE9076434.1 sugar transferase [Romeria aff. gracilis LEGE 07310]
MTNGVYILANDVVQDQLIALLNSLERNVGADLPVCVIPYDDRTELCRQATQDRPQVQWFDDAAILEKWETYAAQIWQAHPTAYAGWQQRGVRGVNRLGMHRRFCCFDGPFERFIYLDADILAMGSFAPFFAALDHCDFVTYDFQYKDLSHVYDVQASQLTEVFSRSRLETEIFCAGLFASKRGLFSDQQLATLLNQLQAGDAAILYPNGPDQSILNYLVMKSNIRAINLARSLPAERRTGCCVTSPHFIEQDHVLFDQGEPLTYLHYIGVGSGYFRQLCEGQNIGFPYRDLFLYYRYLHAPEQRPQFSGSPRDYQKPAQSKVQRLLKKVGLAAR